MASVIAKLREVRMSVIDARLVADKIRRMSVDKASDFLRFSQLKPAKAIKKLLDSAIANAENNAGLDIDELRVETIYVDAGATFKRSSARAKGRGNRITRPTCHVTIKLASKEGV